MPDSICPKGWRLPKSAESYTSADSEYSALLIGSNITTVDRPTSYNTDGFKKIRQSPLWVVRSGYAGTGTLNNTGNDGYYWPSAVNNDTNAYTFYVGRYNPYPLNSLNRSFGRSVRCVAN